MKMTKTGTMSVLLSAVLACSSMGALAQDHHDDQHGNEPPPHPYVQHNEWHKGAKINNADWGRGQQVDYRSHHLSAPPRGYEWREVDGNYVMAAVATGLIASALIASAH